MTAKKKVSKSHREDFQKKQVRSQKSMRGQPETEYGEVKKIASYSLTPTSIELLKSISKKLQVSTSELLERIARGKYALVMTDQSEIVEE